MSTKDPFDISGTDRLGATGPVTPGPISEGKGLGTPAQTFQSYMQQSPGANPLAAQTPPASMSPFDLAHGQTTLAASPSYNTLLTQVNSTANTLGGIQNQLSYPNLKLKDAHKYVLNDKLPEANALLRSANGKLGTEAPAPTPPSPGGGPIMKFLNMVSDGQNQIEAAKFQIQKLKDKGDSLNPADMLLVQVKLNKAQQLLDFSSILLSKAVDGFKQLMQTQL